MKIEQLKEIKGDLEMQIYKLILEFEEMTGLHIHKVNLDQNSDGETAGCNLNIDI